ncbi:MAG: zf-TFIIB domain-containing protein [Candidatus Wildermuthbacteria bacterium]|nr:zf-TFIIB domain-containing protein [Candidatus Wildermuthbacteria bacterium]
MRCPVCKTTKLDKALLSGVEVDYCPKCYGLWFEEDELREAKDEKDRSLRWLDIDLWKDIKEFRIARGMKMCPVDRVPLYEVQYGDSQVQVDLCNLCRGTWLDRGEFKDIIAYLKEKAQHEVLYHYVRTVASEGWEIFAGPEMLKEEILDFLAVLKILQYKFAVQHPLLAKLMLSLPK